ncbi:hypothetical protein RSOLAG22IIIB_11833 [Rhizoctonia solani]|uniref:Uncharacterized protein n=1 Tax=Rhizoctonia solani TaxID=456999 RepID=A0A0K6GAD1_9AGAM|nr:hypothetical protein RSOLAG22IIIB_11833 [Rhizoctonia solani]
MSNTSSVQPSLTLAQLEPPCPRAKRHKGINALPDSEATNYSPQEILEAVQETWRSHSYGHYRSEVDLVIDHESKVVKRVSKFYCKYNEPNHHVISRDRLRTSNGTRNLCSTAQECDVQRRVLGVICRTPNLSILGSNVEFSEPLHIALLAIKCARDHRSFSSVSSDLRRAEAQLLRPGIHLPTATTVSYYVRYIYLGASLLELFYTEYSLETPFVPSDILPQYGGIIPYRNAQFASCPRLTPMALDCLTASASSVDAERGRPIINHLQHQMSSQTFQSQSDRGLAFLSSPE